MGCDVHYVVESFNEDSQEWECLSKVDPDYPEELELQDKFSCFGGRNYALFGVLAQGVRSTPVGGLPVKGWPDNASQLAQDFYSYWGCDGHSHTHITLEELKTTRNKILLDPNSFYGRELNELRLLPTFEELIEEMAALNSKSENIRLAVFFDN